MESLADKQPWDEPDSIDLVRKPKAEDVQTNLKDQNESEAEANKSEICAAVGSTTR